MIEVALAKEVLQWGFDETSIEGTPTLNQWVVLPNGALAPRLVTIQCAGHPSPSLFFNLNLNLDLNLNPYPI